MNVRHRSEWLLLVILASAAARGEMATLRIGTPPRGAPGKAEPPRAKPPTAYAAEARPAPQIDGKPDDKAWDKARPLRITRTLDGTGPAPQPSEVRLLRDEKSLYIAVRCVDPLVDKVEAQRRPHDDDLWQDDSVEVFLGFEGAYFHFGVNTAGSTYDAKGKDRGWNSGF